MPVSKVSRPQVAKSDRQKEDDNSLVFSYMTMRNFIGLFGMALPLVLFLLTRPPAGHLVLPSISDYYYSKNGDILVVLLSILGVFLFTYKGYGNDWKERALTLLAALGALGVAFSPTGSIDDIMETQNIIEINEKSVHTAISFRGALPHFLSAAVFFISVGIISLRYFPKSSEPGKDISHTQKAKRNIMFRICGWTILGAILVLLLYFGLQKWAGLRTDFPVVFALETVAIEAFGISWLTKGETLWPDGEHYMKTAWRKMTK